MTVPTPQPSSSPSQSSSSSPSPSILVIDNYDSFAYNLVQYVGEVVTDPEWGVVAPDGKAAADTDTDTDTAAETDKTANTNANVIVRRNDEIDIDGIRTLDPDGIVVSPGPGTPAEAGVSIPIFAELTYPTLGVCLGHQALCAAHGSPVGHAEAVVHGKPSTIEHDGRGLFADLPATFDVGRYHSLAVKRQELPKNLVETAWTTDEAHTLMGVRHRQLPHYGVQFHPESILTDTGKQLIAAFLSVCTESADSE